MPTLDVWSGPLALAEGRSAQLCGGMEIPLNTEPCVVNFYQRWRVILVLGVVFLEGRQHA